MKSLSISLTLVALVVFPSCYVTVPFQGLPKGAEAPALDVEIWVNATPTEDIDAPRERPILIEFWSSDCAPCIRSIPKLKRVAADHVGQLDVLTVHVDLDEDDPLSIDDLNALVFEHGIGYPVGLDTSGEQWSRYAFGHLPHAVFVDVDGRVLWSGNLVLHDVEKHAARVVEAARRQAKH